MLGCVRSCLLEKAELDYPEKCRSAQISLILKKKNERCIRRWHRELYGSAMNNTCLVIIK